MLSCVRAHLPSQHTAVAGMLSFETGDTAVTALTGMNTMPVSGNAACTAHLGACWLERCGWLQRRLRARGQAGPGGAHVRPPWPPEGCAPPLLHGPLHPWPRPLPLLPAPTQLAVKCATCTAKHLEQPACKMGLGNSTSEWKTVLSVAKSLTHYLLHVR